MTCSRTPATIICYNEDEAKEVFSNWLDRKFCFCACAHNSGFDFNKTFVAECIDGLEFIDTWLAFYDTIGQYAKYNKFCAENGFVTEKGNIQMSAEVCYRFISGNVDFVEEHTAHWLIAKLKWKSCVPFGTLIEVSTGAHKGDGQCFKNVKCRF